MVFFFFFFFFLFVCFGVNVELDNAGKLNVGIYHHHCDVGIVLW